MYTIQIQIVLSYYKLHIVGDSQNQNMNLSMTWHADAAFGIKHIAARPQGAIFE